MGQVLCLQSLLVVGQRPPLAKGDRNEITKGSNHNYCQFSTRIQAHKGCIQVTKECPALGTYTFLDINLLLSCMSITSNLAEQL